MRRSQRFTVKFLLTCLMSRVCQLLNDSIAFGKCNRKTAVSIIYFTVSKSPFAFNRNEIATPVHHSGFEEDLHDLGGFLKVMIDRD